MDAHDTDLTRIECGTLVVPQSPELENRHELHELTRIECGVLLSQTPLITNGRALHGLTRIECGTLVVPQSPELENRRESHGLTRMEATRITRINTN